MPVHNAFLKRWVFLVGVGVGWVTGVLLLYVCITSRLPIIAKLINIRVVVVANTRCYDDMTHDVTDEGSAMCEKRNASTQRVLI